jgi:hypothetical protein
VAQAMYDCVDRKRFDARLADVAKKAKKRLATLLARTRTGPDGFANYSADVITENVWLNVVSQVGAAKPHVTVEDIQIFAVGEVLRMADSRHADDNLLRAWARIVELTQPGSMQSAR